MTKTCPLCGETYDARYRTQKTCGTNRCRQRAKRARRPPRLCRCGAALRKRQRTCDQCRRGPIRLCARCGRALPRDRPKWCTECAGPHNNVKWIPRGAIRTVSCRYCDATWEQPARQGIIVCESCKLAHRQTSQRRRREKQGRGFSDATRLLIAEAYAWRCGICGDPIEQALARVSTYNDWALTVDHIVPRAHGGGDNLFNLQPAHWWCNSVKGDQLGFTLRRTLKAPTTAEIAALVTYHVGAV